MLLPKIVPWRSKRYRDYVASLPCCVPRCGCPADDPHHEQAKAQGGMGTRPSDERCIPLCRRHHDMRQHGKRGRAIWEDWDRDPEEVIKSTQAEWLRRGNKAGWLE